MRVERWPIQDFCVLLASAAAAAVGQQNEKEKKSLSISRNDPTTTPGEYKNGGKNGESDRKENKESHFLMSTCLFFFLLSPASFTETQTQTLAWHAEIFQGRASNFIAFNSSNSSIIWHSGWVGVLISFLRLYLLYYKRFSFFLGPSTIPSQVMKTFDSVILPKRSLELNQTALNSSKIQNIVYYFIS